MLLIACVAVIAISGAVPPAVGVAVTKTARSLKAMRWMARG
jgi:hypothetical protein